jgi:NAD(P)-dependent dehydrogenase (short-subunit alcohol dehydrogenase family)
MEWFLLGLFTGCAIAFAVHRHHVENRPKMWSAERGYRLIACEEESERLRDALDAAEARERAAYEYAAQDVEQWGDEDSEPTLIAIAASIRALSDTDALAEYVERETVLSLIQALKDEPAIDETIDEAAAFNAGWDAACIEALAAIRQETNDG